MENRGRPIREWWKECVVYQIYPRSFRDSDGDGIGDLNGIIEKLGYIKSLGVDVIWLNPIFASPNDDNGYDISDYREIMPEFGTMRDFERLLAETHRLGMKLILDLVVNHTSDEHPWFVEARKSRESPFYGYYHWWPAEKGEPPYRESYFDEDGYAWKYNEPTDSWYLHYFSRKQPDLNWNNPDLRREVYDIVRFWLDKGIDGFRMDSIPLIGKDPTYPVINRDEYASLFDAYAKNPETHRYLHEMNVDILSPYDILTVGEGSAVKVEDAWKFVDPAREELQMLYHFGPSETRNFSLPDSPDSGIPYSLVKLKAMFSDWDKKIGKGWPVIYLGNHDQPRMVSRFGSDDPKYRKPAAKMLATLLLTLRGTVYWYAGDEIGMANIRFKSISRYRDISTINGYIRTKKEKGDLKRYMLDQQETSRDNGRTPFQWNDRKNAGFSAAEPWLSVNPDYRRWNARSQEAESDSVLNYFRALMWLRKGNDTLIYGKFKLVEPKNIRIFAYTRTFGGKVYFIALNFSPHQAEVTVPNGLKTDRPVIFNYGDIPTVAGGILSLRPFEAAVFFSEK